MNRLLKLRVPAALVVGISPSATAAGLSKPLFLP